MYVCSNDALDECFINVYSLLNKITDMTTHFQEMNSDKEKLTKEIKEKSEELTRAQEQLSREQKMKQPVSLPAEVNVSISILWLSACALYIIISISTLVLYVRM